MSRERYAEPRASIEEKVLKWSGMETSSSGALETASGDGIDTTVTATAGTAPAPSLDLSVQYPKIETAEEKEKSTGEYLTIKPERMAAIIANKPQPQGKKDKPKFPHTCTRCAKVWNLAIQLDPSRPMYCSECRPIVMEERAHRDTAFKEILRSPPPPTHTPPPDQQGQKPTSKIPEPTANRPRIVKSAGLPTMSPSVKRPDQSGKFLTEILKAKEQVKKNPTPASTTHAVASGQRVRF